MKERNKDRRSYAIASCFPLEDRNGCIIPFNRSNRPDRRLQNYRLHEIDTEEFILHSAGISFGTT